MTTSSEILPPTELQTIPANPLAQPTRKPRGKIAELPEALRNELNQMLNDGVPYKRVADHMNATHKLDLNTTNNHRRSKTPITPVGVSSSFSSSSSNPPPVEVESSALKVQSSPSAATSLPSVNSDPEIRINPGPSVNETPSSPQIENPNASAICDLPSAISEPTPMAYSNTENPFPCPEEEGRGEGERSGPQLENSPSADEVTSRTPPDLKTEHYTLNTDPHHPNLLTCQCCRADLPPLLPDGQRPSPFCPKCRSALRHPATLKFYCPTCRGDIRDIWNDDVRTSDNCPRCHAHLPPPPIWPPQSPPPQSSGIPGQLSHAE